MPDAKGVIVVVEDETQQREMLVDLLAAAGYDVHAAADGHAGAALALKLRPHLVVLDIAMPGLDGLSVCRLLKADFRTRRIPILILTSNATSDNRVRAVEYAADHFLAKPVADVEEFQRWVRALLRRGGPAPASARVVGGVLTLNDEETLVSAPGVPPVSLPPKLYALLAELAERPGQAVSRERLIEKVWNNEVRDREVDWAVNRVRRALGPAGNVVAAVRGTGYRLDLDALRRP